MNKLKMLFLETCFISLGIFFGVGAVSAVMHLLGQEYSSDWYFSLSVVLAGFLCSFPSLILFSEKIKPFFVRILIHFAILFGAVSLLGWLFKWYSGILSYAVVMGIFICVYIFVWVITKWIYNKDDKEINNALTSFRDEE